MTKFGEIYLCKVCGNVVEVLFAGGGQLVCCGQPMSLQTENTSDGAWEKHVPDVQREGNKIKVQIGSTLHPMEPQHYIEWIELIQGNRANRIYIHPGEEPRAEFLVDDGDFSVRAYCNLHGLWKNDNSANN